jgi:signal peptidase II
VARAALHEGSPSLRNYAKVTPALAEREALPACEILCPGLGEGNWTAMLARGRRLTQRREGPYCRSWSSVYALYGNAFFVSFGALTLLVDQVTKAAASDGLVSGRLCRIVVEVGIVPRLAGRGFLVALPRRRAVILVTLVVMYVEGMLALGVELSPVTCLGIGLAVGGALGNLSDLLRRGGILDFIAVAEWRVFNLADVAMLCGAVLALVGAL